MRIIPRKDWGAAKPNGPIYTTSAASRTGFAVHHSVGSTGGDPEGAEALIRGFQQLHQRNGWGDLGYNFLIDAWGNIYEGRGLHAVGAHAGGANTANIGVCYIGDGRYGEMTDAAKEAFQDLYAWSNQQLGKKLAHRVHGDLNSTVCPGQFIRAWVKGGGLNGGDAGGTPVSPAAPGESAPSYPTVWGGRPVSEIQKLLRARGFATKVDNQYGPDTKARVMEFQASRRLLVDGDVGPQTWAELNRPAPAVGVVMATIRRGSKGETVSRLQSILKRVYPLYAGALVVDGDFGPKTEAAVKEFQRRSGLVDDGIVGPLTWGRLV